MMPRIGREGAQRRAVLHHRPQRNPGSAAPMALGPPLHMGPGYFPVMLGTVLLVLGVACQTTWSAHSGSAAGLQRGVATVGLPYVAAIVGFGLMIERGGLLLAVLWLVLCACAAGPRFSRHRSHAVRPHARRHRVRHLRLWAGAVAGRFCCRDEVATLMHILGSIIAGFHVALTPANLLRTASSARHSAPWWASCPASDR